MTTRLSQPDPACETFERTTPIAVSPQELFDWHARPGAFERLAPPWQRVELVEGRAEIRDGSRLRLRLYKGPLPVTWLAEHRNVRPGRGFEDVQLSGPFKLWEHAHEFEPDGSGGSLLRDRIHYLLPGGAAGVFLAGPSIRRDLERTFTYRHRTTAEDLELHRRFATAPRLRVAISGASGLIGSVLSVLLSTGGHQVVRLVRGRSRDGEEVVWDPASGIAEPERLDGIDAVVHLAGESIGEGRWTATRKERIRRSRVEGTRSLVTSLGSLERPPRVLLVASAVGYYGDRGEEPLSETNPPGEGFLSEVCRSWEEAARGAEAFGARVATARFGVVLSPRGGALAKMLPPFRLGAGGVLGSGDQYLSWISVDDAAAALLHLLMSEELAGPVNVTAPRPVTNRELTRALGRVLGRPTLAPLPAPALRALFGQMGEETLLASTRALPERLIADGFCFRDPDLEGALRHLLGRTRWGTQ